MRIYTEDDLKYTVGERLRDERVRQGYSQGKLVKKLSIVTRSQYSRWENGIVMPSAKNLCEVAKVLNICVLDLFKPL